MVGGGEGGRGEEERCGEEEKVVEGEEEKDVEGEGGKGGREEKSMEGGWETEGTRRHTLNFSATPYLAVVATMNMRHASTHHSNAPPNNLATPYHFHLHCLHVYCLCLIALFVTAMVYVIALPELTHALPTR